MRARNGVIVSPGRLDRSPCGTGCCARMAVLHAQGALSVGEAFTGISILGSRFDCRIDALTDVGGVPAIVPTLSGRAWITDTRQMLLDPADPWPQGYRIGDTWPNA
mgnify:CR=1 FL=1